MAFETDIETYEIYVDGDVGPGCNNPSALLIVPCNIGICSEGELSHSILDIHQTELEEGA